MLAKKLKKLHFSLILLVFTLLAILPLIVYPNFLVGRGNDLQEFFLPLIIYTKHSILSFHELPLWNGTIFSGTPLVSDPQSPIFYPPNLIHLIIKPQPAFLFLTFAHLYAASLGAFIFLKKELKFSENASYLGSFLYLFAPRLASQIEAGHVGLIYSWAYLPWLLFFIKRTATSKSLIDSIGMGLFLAGLFFTHTPTFIIVALISPVLFALFWRGKTPFIKNLSYFIVGGSVGLGLVALSLLPQIAWQGITTRQFLLQNPEIFPVWHSKGEFTKAALNPFFLGSNAIWELDTEKYISLGIFSLALAAAGWWHLKSKLKVSAFLGALLIGLITLNNASPLYPLFLQNQFFILLRVMTRVWFVAIGLVCVLAAFGFENSRTKRPKLTYLVVALLILESLIVFWGRLAKPIPHRTEPPIAVYEYLQKNRGQSRIFCTTRCLKQSRAVEYGLELIEGYNTLAQQNYFQRAMVMMGTFWHDKYDLSIPPSWITYSEKLDPHAVYLAEYSVGFVVSPHAVSDENMTLVEEIEGYKIYKNSLAKPRAYFENGTTPDLIHMSPNKLTYQSDGKANGRLILSEVFSPGWHAKIDGKKVSVTENEIAQRSIEVPKGSRTIEIYYLPHEFVWGLTITTAAIVFIVSYAIYKKNKN